LPGQCKEGAPRCKGSEVGRGVVGGSQRCTGGTNLNVSARRKLRALFGGVEYSGPVVCLHTWGTYPFKLLGKERLWERSTGAPLADVYEEFWRMFPCDWLHVCEAISPPQGEQRDGHRIAGRRGFGSSQLSLEAVNAWVQTNADGLTVSIEEALAMGLYDHVKILFERIGEGVMITPNQEAPGSHMPMLSWEDEMLLIQERPEIVERFVRLDSRRFLSRVHAARKCGADCYIFSEGYGGAFDLTSPEQFRRVFLRAKQEFYGAVRDAGVHAIVYGLGNVLPYMDWINQIGIDGLMIEESKKGFVLDPAEIRMRLDPRVVLFGNLPSRLLLEGTPREIEAEVHRQARAREHGKFVFMNGSPICPGTPPANIHAFLECARNGNRS